MIAGIRSSTRLARSALCQARNHFYVWGAQQEMTIDMLNPHQCMNPLIYDEFIARSVEMAKKRKLGDPMDLSTQQGPQVDEEQLRTIERYVEYGKKEGAKLVAGGKKWGDKGFFFEPTIFADVKDEMTIAQEE
ncbi:hypothetical protein OSTOST_24706, partial [Ostertagia ostertagi]